ncbi:hypothetical protein BX616_000838 [Lobosporangium transversale]|uniref:Uncharacterized protein n=1 Tax=Lobosporangium transversale TaxID=64571 RepID=A0A1Y2H0I0_9FUNG|nr:hypothetical protein BCR41DRAFT_346444 [Lobosporangium transversale]KAF9919150.1 hypothetical protein BX616_000838 [Lobosporangium transversale]ORZ28048.1 hypothetical protein BCR41DRAFT_346444 [Lobosporangium transversale]|eukprot:XP_021885751.1 hypothetical protein BCR41DRAFT_346444 [Lobosporangium transversale]
MAVFFHLVWSVIIIILIIIVCVIRHRRSARYAESIKTQQAVVMTVDPPVPLQSFPANPNLYYPQQPPVAGPDYPVSDPNQSYQYQPYQQPFPHQPPPSVPQQQPYPPFSSQPSTPYQQQPYPPSAFEQQLPPQIPFQQTQNVYPSTQQQSFQPANYPLIPSSAGTMTSPPPAYSTAN